MRLCVASISKAAVAESTIQKSSRRCPNLFGRVANSDCTSSKGVLLYQATSGLWRNATLLRRPFRIVLRPSLIRYRQYSSTAASEAEEVKQRTAQHQVRPSYHHRCHRHRPATTRLVPSSGTTDLRGASQVRRKQMARGHCTLHESD